MQAIVRALIGASLAAALIGAAAAQSMATGECYSKADLETRMARDGQVPIILSTRVTDGAPAVVFTSDSQGRIGYELEGDQTLGVPSNRICVADVFQDIRLFSPAMNTLPRGLEIKPANGLDVHNVYRHGARLVLAAQSFRRDAAGQKLLGVGVAVLANPVKRSGAVWLINNQNEPHVSHIFTNFAFTQHAEKLMK